MLGSSTAEIRTSVQDCGLDNVHELVGGHQALSRLGRGTHQQAKFLPVNASAVEGLSPLGGLRDVMPTPRNLCLPERIL